MFDASIGVQSWLYSEKRKTAQERSRRRRHLYGLDAEEEAALLDGETEDDVTETETDDGLHSRSASIGPTRSRSSRRTLSRKGSDSTELGTRKAGSRSRSRASRDKLEDRRFDFDAASTASGSGERASPGASASTSRGGTRASSVASSKLVEIAEQGESTVTLR